jgi:hypothetical protein
MGTLAELRTGRVLRDAGGRRRKPSPGRATKTRASRCSFGYRASMSSATVYRWHSSW